MCRTVSRNAIILNFEILRYCPFKGRKSEKRREHYTWRSNDDPIVQIGSSVPLQLTSTPPNLDYY